MTTRPRTLIPLAVVAAFLMVGLAACSGGTASVKNAADDPTTEESEPTEGPCDAVATVYGTTYHVVQVASQDYGVKPDVQVEGEATDCNGTTTRPMTFHAIPEVDPSWALCGLVEGRWRVFLSDTLGPVPADSVLAHIVVGK